MEAVWNQMHLERPTNITWRVEINKFDIERFMSSLKCADEDLRSQNCFHTEAAILSRIIYRMKRKFRNDKGLKNMEKVNRALLSYLALDLKKEYKNLYSYIEAEGKFVILPSRQMLEYVLVRTQGFAKLLVRVEEVAKSAGIHLRGRIIMGDAWILAIVPYAVVSRIWLLSRHLVKKSCTWYNGLHKYLEKLKIVGVPWMREKQELPTDLAAWLNLPWLSEKISSIPPEAIWKDTMFKLLKIQDDESFDNLEFTFVQEPMQLKTEHPTFNVPKQDISMKLSASTSKDTAESSMFMHDDIGEYINRYNFKEKDQNSLILNETKNHEEHLERSSILKFHMQEEQKEEKEVKRLEESKRKSLDECTLSSKIKIKKNERIKQEKLSNINLQNNIKLQLEHITTKSYLIKLLSKDSFSGVDKLRWNMIKNNSKKFIQKLNKCNDKNKEKVLVKKAVKCIESWIS